MAKPVRLDTTRFQETLGRFQRFLPPTLRQTALAAALMMAAHAHDRKFIQANPPFLNRRTGTAARSVSASPRARLTRDRAIGIFGSHIEYVRKHELGGTYREYVPTHRVRAHSRRVTAFRIAGSAQMRDVKVGSYLVRSHYVMKRYRRREMFGTTVREKRDDVPPLLERAIRLLVQLRRTPKAAEILGAA
jgi:hypothetical protein